MRSAPPPRRVAMRSSPWAHIPVVMALFAASAATAQTVTGRVVSRTDGAPVPGAIVALLDSTGRSVSTGLAEDDGTFRLSAPSPGRITVRVERVGFRSTTSAPVLVAQGATVDVPMTIGAEGVSLRAVQVNADRRCLVRPQEGLAAAQLWDEARKALSATQLTQLAHAAARSRSDRHRFTVRTRKTIRDLSPASLQPIHEEQFELEAETVQPFVSHDPDELYRNGYMAGSIDEGAIFYAPDASILLSDRFLDSHCFRVEPPKRSGREDLIGLGFEPTRVGKSTGSYGQRIEVTGVLWLDRATAELRYMEYHYVSLPAEIPNEAAGGLLEFRPLPDGRWIVWRWYIRAPQLIRRESNGVPYATSPPLKLEVKSIHEEGAEILEVLPPGSRRPTLATVHGIVMDSTRRVPVAGARVFLSGTSFAGVTGPDGSYTIDNIAPGKYSMSVLAPRLDSLLLDPPVHEHTLNAGQEAQVNFAVPSVRALAQQLCPGVPATDSSAVLIGVVRDTSGSSANGASVRAEWNEFTRSGSERLARRSMSIETNARAAGRFAICGLPTDRPVTIRARREGNSAVSPVLHVNPGEVQRVDLHLHAP